MAGLFRFRRQRPDSAAPLDAPGPAEPPALIDLDTGVARPDGAVDWVGSPDAGAAPAATANE